MPRNYEAVRLSSDNMQFLLPQEIVAKLDYLGRELAVDLSNPVRRPCGLEQQLALLDGVLAHIEARLTPGPTPSEPFLLTKRHHRYLAYWLNRSMAAARKLQTSQPDTPMGFPKGRRGMLANLLFASWVDLTQGGTIPVEWTLI